MVNSSNSDSKSKSKQKVVSDNQRNEQSFLDVDLMISECIPTLLSKLKANSIEDVKLSFEKREIPIIGKSCWTLYGEFPDLRRFWVCFTGKDSLGPKAMLLASPKCQPTVIEPFLTLPSHNVAESSAIIVASRVIQRLEAQQWLNPA